MLTYFRTLLVNQARLEHAKDLVAGYKQGKMGEMSTELWKAKKIVDSTLHPGSSFGHGALQNADSLQIQANQFSYRFECHVSYYRIWWSQLACSRLDLGYVLYNALTPYLTPLQTTGTLLWQITNQSLNVAVNNANANKSTPLSVSKITQSYFLAVGASCSVALGLNALVPRLKRVSPATKTILTRLVPFAAVASAGALNVFLMRGEEIRQGIDIYPVLSEEDKAKLAGEGKSESTVPSLGKSKKAATLAVSETAISRVLNSSPIMVIPPLILVRLQKQEWLKRNPRLTLPVNLGLILGTSLFALPLALGAFPQRQAVDARILEEEFWGKGGDGGQVVFNRGI